MTPPEPRLCRLLLRILLVPPRPLFLPPNVLTGGHPPTAPITPPPTPVVSPHSIIRPPGREMYPSQHINVPRLAPIIFCPCSSPLTLPRSRHACRIPVAAAPLPLSKLIIPRPSDDYLIPPASATEPVVSPIPNNLSLLHERQK